MWRTRRRGLAVAMAMAAVAAPPAAGAGPRQPERPPGGLRITVTELTDQDGRPLVAVERINDRGQVLGYVETAAGRRLVVLHRGRATPVGPEGFLPHIARLSERGQVAGTLVDDSTFSSRAFSSIDGDIEWLTSPDEYPTSSALAVNDRGQVLGFRQGSGSAEVVVWQRGETVPVPPSPSPTAVPVDINNRGQVVVGSTLWRIGGAPVELGGLGPGLASQATDLNDRGQVAGDGATADGATHAFLWSDGEMTDLGTLGGNRSYTAGNPSDSARILNERGHVVGTSRTADGRNAAFLWRDGEMIEVASVDHRSSWPRAVNDRDQIVGHAAFGPAPSMAWLWQDGRLIDLGALLGDGAAYAEDINDRGQIVGTYDGRAVMWTVQPAP